MLWEERKGSLSPSKIDKKGEKNYIRNQVVNYVPADLIKDISAESCVKESVVEEVLNSFKEVVTRHLAETDKKTDIAIKVFKGLKLTSKTRISNEAIRLGIAEEPVEKILIKATFTRTFKDKMRLYKH